MIRKFRCQRMAIAMFFYTPPVAFRVLDLPGLRQIFACTCPSVIMPTQQDSVEDLLNSSIITERRCGNAMRKNSPYVAFVAGGWPNPRPESRIYVVVAAGTGLLF